MVRESMQAVPSFSAEVQGASSSVVSRFKCQFRLRRPIFRGVRDDDGLPETTKMFLQRHPPTISCF